MPPERKPLDVTDLARKYLNGLSINQLAREFNVSRPLVTRRLRELGIKLRDQSESETVKWSQMDDHARINQVAAAHAATRGKPSNSDLELRAMTIERLAKMTSNEILMKEWLNARGIMTIPQKAIGPYNCDLATSPVTVEIFGGGWHWVQSPALARLENRIRYILNSGWHLLIIPVSDAISPLTPAVADYIVSYIQQARSNPSSRREYRVVWRAGEFSVCGYADDDKISIEQPFTRTRDLRTGQYKTVPR